MDFRNVKSLMIGGRAVAKLLIGGRLAWQKAKPEPVVEGAYIETDGQSYMDLGIVPDVRTSYEIDVMHEGGKYTGTTTLRNCAYGCATGVGTVSASHVLYLRVADGFLKFAKPTSNNFTEVVPGVRFKVSVSTAADGRSSISVGDHAETVNNNYTAGTTMKFGCSYTESPDFYATARFYSAKFWQDGVLVRDLVPYSGPRGVGLLDRVHDVLYTNAGGGSLTYGVEAQKSPYVQTKGLSDSFWAAPISQLGCSAAPANPEHFAFVVDMQFDDEYFAADYGIFGFTKCNVLYSQNMQSVGASDASVYAYAPGSVINANGIRQIVTPGDRHVITFEFDPLVGNSVDVDGEISSGEAKTLKLPYDTSFKFGGASSSNVVTSVSRPVKMRVYGVKILQFHGLVADLIPYSDGGSVGMIDRVSGTRFPGSNLEYGEE